ncbi:MAG: RsmB/NOP family class I SAM-dependent RNA methyltransferase [Chlamydiae bacterium]|nr:RsmB/NOP family class I SAM-dependent RNA methyltransferase [Chlamydiota bacterium]
MKKPFKEFHILKILTDFEKTPCPLDLYLKNYFYRNRAIGSKDRKFISETIYGIFRFRCTIDYLCEKPINHEKRLAKYLNLNLLELIHDPTIPDSIRVNFPDFFYQMLIEDYGKEKAVEFCQILNQPAPTTIRINPLKTSRESLFRKWKEQFSIVKTGMSELGLQFQKKINFFALPEFKQGFFEIQDEASQLCANLVAAKPKQKVLDFCAGSGGKTLAFAHKMEGKGQIYLHDIRLKSLQEAKNRLKRAGIQNAQIIQSSMQKNILKGKMDWVIADVPCSGSGTLRRNPDIKWKWNPESFKNILSQQKEIVKEAVEFLHSSGRLVYITCSIFKKENQEQVAYFKKNFSLIEKAFFQSFPTSGGMDGFCAFVLKKE